MSQDQYYYNPKRLRAENNLPLSEIELNKVYNASNISTMSSIKKNTSRLSARQSMTGASRASLVNSNIDTQKRKSSMGLSEMIQQSNARHSSRKSLIGATPGPRSSNNRVSSFGLGSLSQSKDPRPLRDRNYQQQIQEEILDFLLSTNFENEMRHPVSTKSLRNPTQKDFVVIFQYLYKKIDQGYRFTKSIEHEVYYVLKNLKYPYLDSINKSQISAVGGQNWPVFLGMIHWLTSLIKKINTVSINLEKSQESGNNELNIPIDEENNELETEKIFIRYIMKSYSAFLNNVDDYSEFYEEMKNDYGKLAVDIANETKDLEQENMVLKSQYNKIVVEAESLNLIERKSRTLESDLHKFKAYIESLQNRKSKWNNILQQIKNEMENSENDLKSVEEEKRQIQKNITDQGLTPEEIDRMNSERDRVSKSIDAINQRLDEISRVVHAKELETQQVHEKLQNALKAYNLNAYSVASSFTDIDYSSFIVKLDNLLSEDKLGLRAEELLNGQDIKTKIRNELTVLKNNLKSQIHGAQDEVINLQEKSDSLAEMINEKTEQVDSIETKLSKGKLNYEELYETMNKESTSYHTEIERYENELRQMQMDSNKKVAQLDQHIKSIELDQEKLIGRIQHERNLLHNKAQKMMDIVITFKLNVQGSLEDLENMVTDELQLQTDQGIIL
ncbi:hypothetical protein WICMUC_003418 [Wickerhamomyces mucosus]|uniref:Kinetochore protein NDC80 n=1 Tax=Wickerhamomyces mucosus TaxID=1378264 RepID=A0A9P8TCK6_9ASCO|nr:hypothetical protein WICMUC_003418 [Wickerhamomyces mucosus]